VQPKVGEEQVRARIFNRERLGVRLRQLDLVERELLRASAGASQHLGREVEAEVVHPLLRP
jgi:hypothetical protein